MPSEQGLQRFREIYRKEFGIDISPEEAAEQATRLLNLARVVMQPMPRAWEKKYNELFHENKNNDE